MKFEGVMSSNFPNPKSEERQISAWCHIADLHSLNFSSKLYHSTSMDFGFMMILIFQNFHVQNVQKILHATIFENN